MRALSILALLFVLFVSPAGAQGPYSGLTIISLRTTTDSYLIDLDLGVVKTWHGTEVPTELAYMLPDSSIIRPCRVPDVDGRGGRWSTAETYSTAGAIPRSMDVVTNPTR